ncbi:MAG TPA: hypothetical protein VHX44_06245 [Planctomycetota bacterium]|jgi:hypothetical protein|nr:hypothetical protein [Planctomycetota bacterium]
MDNKVAPPISCLATRATILSPIVTWRLEGDHLVREKPKGNRMELPIADLDAVRLWRSLVIRNLGGHLEARVRVAGRWWRLSAHNAEGPGRIRSHNAALMDVLGAVVRRRQAIGGELDCCIGSSGQRIGAMIMAVVLFGFFVVIGYALSARGLPPKGILGLLVIAGILFGFLLLTFRLAKGGRQERLTVDEFLRHPLVAPPADSIEARLREVDRVLEAVNQHGKKAP